jgi:hypothetical protein
VQTQPGYDLRWLDEPNEEPSHLLPALVVGGIVGFGLILALIRTALA